MSSDMAAESFPVRLGVATVLFFYVLCVKAWEAVAESCSIFWDTVKRFD